MSARHLTLLLSIVTAALWAAFALISHHGQIPLWGVMPISLWKPESSIWLLVPLVAFCAVPVIAWKKESRVVAWMIPFIPVAGAVLFFLRFAFGMSDAFR
ncbi:MAG: hypothetical protein KBC32_11400 [Candidatus Didemnitutus sp.]|nr:hypothetical protein [Candidatus Didemnitutus sp.]